MSHVQRLGPRREDFHVMVERRERSAKIIAGATRRVGVRSILMVRGTTLERGSVSTKESVRNRQRKRLVVPGRVKLPRVRIMRLDAASFKLVRKCVGSAGAWTAVNFG